MSVSLEHKQRQRRERIQQELERILQELQEQAQRIVPAAQHLFQEESAFVLRGGKRIRGLLLWRSYEWHGGANERVVVQVAAAIELLHAAILTRDDIIDRDTLRRGAPTLPQAFPASKRGRDIALRLGNQLAALGYRALVTLPIEDERRSAVLTCLEEMAQKTGMGAVLELDGAYQAQLPRERLERMERLKTAHYTVQAPLRIGAALAGTTLHADLDELALRVGKAFQWRDDQLNMRTEQETGKTAWSDVREGRDTPLLQEVRAQLSSSERERIEAGLAAGPDEQHTPSLRLPPHVQEQMEQRVQEMWADIQDRLRATEALSKEQKTQIEPFLRSLLFRRA